MHRGGEDEAVGFSWLILVCSRVGGEREMGGSERERGRKGRGKKERHDIIGVNK